MAKRIEISGYIEVPDSLEVDPGWTANFKGKGEVTGVGEKLTRLASGETKVTHSVAFKADADHTSFAGFKPPEGPLDEALAEG